MPNIPYPCTRCGRLVCSGPGQLCSTCRDSDEAPTRPTPSEYLSIDLGPSEIIRDFDADDWRNGEEYHEPVSYYTEEN